MANDLHKEFEAEQDLGSSFENEQDLAQGAPSDRSTLQDMATLGLKGSQLGLTDEFKGIGAALGSKLSDTDLARWLAGVKVSPEQEKMLQGMNVQEPTAYEEFRKAQKAAEAEQDAALKSSPYAGRVAEFAGGLIPGIATGGLAKATPILTATGAGALTGFGSSHSNIEDPGQLAADAAIGGGTGFALGKLGQKLFGPKAAPVEQDLSNSGEFLPQLKTAQKMGEEGISLSSKPAARQALTNRLQENERQIANQYIEPRNVLGKALEEPLNETGQVLTQSMDDVGAMQNVEEVLSANIKAIGQAKARPLIEKAKAMAQGLLSPKEAYAFKKELSDILPKIADQEQQQIVKTGTDVLKNVLEESVPGFAGKAKDFAQFAQKGPESLLAKGFDPEVADVFLGDMSKGNLKISEKVRDLLNTIRSGGTTGLKKQGEFFNAMKQLEQLAEENPELVQKLGIDPKKLTQQFLQKADEAAVANKAVGESVLQTGYERGKFGLRKASEVGLLKGANLYGQAKRTVRDFVNSSAEELASYAQALKEKGGPGLVELGDSLERALTNGDIQKRNAAIFSLMQIPKAKELLGIHSGEEEEK